MYSDPSRLRDHVIKIRLHDVESELIDALVHYTGDQKATLLREMLLEQARAVLGMDTPLFSSGSEGHNQAQFGTY